MSPAVDRAVTRALVVIDVQESFRRRPTWRDVSNPMIVERVTELVATFPIPHRREPGCTCAPRR